MLTNLCGVAHKTLMAKVYLNLMLIQDTEAEWKFSCVYHYTLQMELNISSIIKALSCNVKTKW